MQTQRLFMPHPAVLALTLPAWLIGASLVMADDAYVTGSGYGYYSASGMGQGTYPSAYVNGVEDGYDFCSSSRIISCGTIFTICWMLYVPDPEVPGQAEGRGAGQKAGRERMYLAQRAIPADAERRR